MNYGHRKFLLLDDGTIVRISNDKWFRAYRGDEPLPEYAGKRVRSLSLHLELKDRKPIRVDPRYDAIYLWFDAQGYVDQDKGRELQRLRLDLAFSPPTDEATLAAKEAELEELTKVFEWEATAEEKRAIEKLIWPKGKP